MRSNWLKRFFGGAGSRPTTRLPSKDTLDGSDIDRITAREAGVSVQLARKCRLYQSRAVARAVRARKRVRLRSFVTFSASRLSARSQRMPDGTHVSVPERDVPRAKPAPAWKAYMKRPGPEGNGFGGG